MKKSLLIQRSFPVSRSFNVGRSAVGLLLLLFISNFSFAQNPLVKQWDYRFGGTGGDYLVSFERTKDGGFILAGNSESDSSGDKTQDSWGAPDYWVIKIDSSGNKIFDKRYGGNSWDWLSCIKKTKDGGYILGGSSGSPISGDKTQDAWGLQDYWIVKIDSLGNILWDKRFGGSNTDGVSYVEQTKDGGYILGGSSASDISGDKSQGHYGTIFSVDYWLIKIDSLGTKQWDRDYGGDFDDYLVTVHQTIDNGYILAGYSESLISGTKTQASMGMYDYYIVKIDSVGNQLWDKVIGGSQTDWLYQFDRTADGGYILGGMSQSGLSGNKTEPTWGFYDYWIVKTDSLLNIQWDKDFGGTYTDYFGNIVQTSDKGYLIGGSSDSDSSGNKTENNLGPHQTWALKTDSIGNFEWDKTIFTEGNYSPIGFALQTKDGCYVFTNFNDADTGGYKTQSSWGAVDYWIVKFCQSAPAFDAISNSLCEKFCTNFFDQSSNNPTGWQWIFSGGDPAFSSEQNPANICYDMPGVYDVTLITTSANGTDTFTLPDYITVYPTPPFPSITQVGYTLTSSAASSYQWQLNSADIPGTTNQSYTILQTGYYTVVVSDSNGCINSFTVYMLISGIQDVISDGNIFIYPNPSSGIFMVELLNGLMADEVSIDIMNTLGQIIFSSIESPSIRTSPYKKEIDLARFADGVYYITLKSENIFFIKKLMIAR